MKNKKYGFTLAETLITLVVIGVVSVMVIPTIINKMNDIHFKMAYKKAYSDINQAFREEATLNQFVGRDNNCYDVNFANYTWNKLKEKFQVLETCENNNGFKCWVQSDTIYDANKPNNSEYAFIDLSGRTWMEFHRGRGIYLVDTNGEKGPNRFGKDRWTFNFYNYDKANISTNTCAIDPTKPIIILPSYYTDITVKNGNCNYPPCYYKKWLEE